MSRKDRKDIKNLGKKQDRRANKSHRVEKLFPVKGDEALELNPEDTEDLIDLYDAP